MEPPITRHSAKDMFRRWVQCRDSFFRGDQSAIYQGNYIVSYFSIWLLYKVSKPVLERLWPDPLQRKGINFDFTRVQGVRVENVQELFTLLQKVRSMVAAGTCDNTKQSGEKIAKAKKSISGLGPHLGMYQVDLEGTASCIDRQVLRIMNSLGNETIVLQKKASRNNLVSHVGIKGSRDNYELPYTTVREIRDRLHIFETLTTSMLYRVEEYLEYIRELYRQWNIRYPARYDRVLAMFQEDIARESSYAMSGMRTTRSHKNLLRADRMKKRRSLVP